MTKRSSPFHYSHSFQRKAAALLIRKQEVLEAYRYVLEVEYFEGEDIRQLIQQVYLYFDRHGKAPPMSTLRRILPSTQKKKPYHTGGWKGLLKDIKSIPKEDYEPVQEELENFMKDRLFMIGTRTAVEQLDMADFEGVEFTMMDTLSKMGSLDGGLIGSNGKPERSLLGLGFKGKGVNNVNGVEPKLHEAALYGIAGEIVKAIEPHTESHPAALLAHILVFFGNIIGKGPHWIAEATRHSLNLFVALVGDTSRGRKGTAEGHGRGVFDCLDEDWVKNNIVSGLSSGEGLIYRVRDKVEIEDDDGEIKVVDPGVKDKRIVAIESELAQILSVMNRKENTLSTKIRQAWDSGNISTMTRKNPIRATDSHISIIAHITREELLRRLKEEDALSGFGNRFMWLQVHRTKELPSGGDLKELNKVLGPLKNELLKVYHWARLQHREIKRSKTAEKYWESLYTVLTKDFPGRFGAITARAEAQTMRLAAIYALLDKSIIIKPQHLAAAYAFWKYSEDSCRYIFGDSLGDPVADSIISVLREHPKGLTRTQIRVDIFQRNKKASELNQTLKNLIDCELVVEVKSKTTGGAPSTTFYHIDHFKGDSSPNTKECTPLTPLANKVALQLLKKATQLYGDQSHTPIQSNGDLPNAFTPPKGSITQQGKELSEEIKKAMKKLRRDYQRK